MKGRYGERCGEEGCEEGGCEGVGKKGVGRREDMERGCEWEVWRGGVGRKRGRCGEGGCGEGGCGEEGMGREDMEGGCGEERRYGGRVLSNVLDSK